ncbi:MAG: Histidine kinase [Deltaproteobacteria bacterium]|nr:Histidine kinase [Deltaproteobacteria bacterium]
MTDQPDSRLAGWRGSIRYRLMAWGLGLLAGALLVSAYIGSVYTRSQIRLATAKLQTEVASATARHVETLVAHKLERLHDAALGMSIPPLGGDEQHLLGLLLLKNDPAFSELAVLNADGLELLKFSETKLYSGKDLQDQRNAAFFREASRGKQFVSAASRSGNSAPFLTLAVPLKTEPVNRGGVVAAKVNLKLLHDTFSERRFSHGGYAYLIDKSGNVIAHPDGPNVPRRIDLKGQAKFTGFVERSAPDGNPGADGQGIGGTQVLSTYAVINELGWAVVVEKPLELALADLAKFHRNGAVLLIAILAVAALVIVWLSGKFTRPIQDLRAGVAIMAHGNLEHRASVKSSDEIGQLASEFNKMADVLKNSYANLEQRIEQRTGQVAALYDVTKTVNQSLDLDRVLQQVVEQITAIFHFDTTRIYLFDGERENLISRAVFEIHPESWTGIQRLGKGLSVAGHVAKTGESLIFDDLQSDPRYAQISASNASRDAGFHFLAMLPIKIHGKLLGTLGLSGKDKRILADEELRLLTSMCEHIALAVEKANLFDQVITRSRQLEVLNTIGAAVSQSLNLDEVHDQAVDKIAKTVGFDAAWIYQLDHADGVLRMKAFHGLSDDMAASVSTLSVHAGVSGQAIETGERLVLEDIQHDERLPALSEQGSVVALEFASAAAFPIMAKEKIIGALHVANRTKRHLAADEIELIQTIAGQIGVASENAKLFAEVSDKTKALAQTNQELLDATRAKAEFIAAMSHELRTPLNIVIGSSDLLHDGFFGELNRGQLDATEKICRNSRVLLKMINDVLTISRFDAGRLTLELATVEVDDIIDQARVLVEQINRDNHLEVRWDIDASIPPLVTDSLKLEEILQNLIGNAFKFTPTGRIEVRVHHRPDQDRVEFTVADTGIGIAAEDQGRIFNAFEQLKEAHTGHFNGVGLGLNIVRRYLDLMQGEISVQSQPGQGAKFTFFVPRSLQLAS